MQQQLNRRYEGGGIYGNTYLITTDEAMLMEYGTFVRSEKPGDAKQKLILDVDTYVINTVDFMLQVCVECCEDIKDQLCASKNILLAFKNY